MSEPIEKPIKPADDDCCGGGACAPCVWDHFYEQLSLYRKQQRATEPLEAKHK
jgi:Oxidoreductase-like protein, N-terminal